MGFSVVPTDTQSSKTVTVTDHSRAYTLTALDLESLRQVFDNAASQVAATGAAPALANVAVNGPTKTITITWTTVP